MQIMIKINQLSQKKMIMSWNFKNWHTSFSNTQRIDDKNEKNISKEERVSINILPINSYKNLKLFLWIVNWCLTQVCNCY